MSVRKRLVYIVSVCVCVAILKTLLLVSSASPTYIENESGGRRVVQRRLSSIEKEKKVF